MASFRCFYIDGTISDALDLVLLVVIWLEF